MKTIIKSNFEQYAEQIFRILFLLCLIAPFLQSLFSSGMNDYLESESIYFHRDNILCNVVILIVGCIVLGLIVKLLMKIRNIDLLAMGMSIVVCLLCVLWIHVSSTKPAGDQELICFFANAFNSGDYSGLERMNYVGVCQHQLGLITYARVLFSLFGSDYHVFQYANAIWVASIVFAGYKFTNLLSKNRFINVVYLVLIICYIPLYIYSPFVYGEIPSIAICMLSSWIFLDCFQNFRWYKPIILGTLIGLAVLLRENSLILGIAMTIVIIVKIISNLFTKKEIKKSVYILIAIIVGIIGLRTFLYKGIYGSKIPEDSHSMPSLVYIAMGTIYNYRNPGVYNAYNITTFMEAGYDVETAENIAKTTLTDFFSYCKENPDYAFEFYYNKFRSQWNVPLQQCFVMTNQFEANPNALVMNIYSGKIQHVICGFMNGWQLFVYLFLVIVCFPKNKKADIEKMVLLVAIFGGMLFSVLWEAKARYVLPYIIMMIPYAANGFYLFTCRFSSKDGQGKIRKCEDTK